MKRPLVVVTGLPGAGKTRLLSLLRPSLDGSATFVKQDGPSRRRRRVAGRGAGVSSPCPAWEPLLTLPASRSARDPAAALGWALFRAADRQEEGTVFLETAGNFEPAWAAEALVHWRDPGETPGSLSLIHI